MRIRMSGGAAVWSLALAAGAVWQGDAGRWGMGGCASFVGGGSGGGLA